MGSKPITPDQEADVRRVFDALRWIVRELRLATSPGSEGPALSAAQLFVLQVLKDHGQLSVGDLAERTATDPSSVSVVIRKLHDKRLVTKHPSAEDQRRLMVGLTAAGARLAAKAPTPVQQVLMARMAQLAPDQLHLLAGLLEKVAPLREGTAPAPMFFQETPRRGRKP